MVGVDFFEEMKGEKRIESGKKNPHKETDRPLYAENFPFHPYHP